MFDRALNTPYCTFEKTCTKYKVQRQCLSAFIATLGRYVPLGYGMCPLGSKFSPGLKHVQRMTHRLQMT